MQQPLFIRCKIHDAAFISFVGLWCSPWPEQALRAVIIVHPKHPLLKVKDLKELEHYDYYSREKGSSIYELVHSYFISHDLDIVPTIECTNPHALIELVKQNDGFSILPYSLVKESKEITYLKNNDFQIQRTYHIVMHKDKKLLPLYQEIFELIKKE